MLAAALAIERLTRVLIWIGGVVFGIVLTAVGSWITSKIHIYHENRKAHQEDLRAKVLIPLREGLKKHFRPLLVQEEPAISLLDFAQQPRLKAKVTEEPTVGGPQLAAKFPFGHVFESIEPALLDDAKTNHFVDLVPMLDALLMDWTDWVQECHQWVCGMAAQIPTACELPIFAPNRTGSYVMSARLALLIYLRLFQFHDLAGAVDKQEQSGHWILMSGGCVAASGSQRQIDALLERLNSLLGSEEARANGLRNRLSILRTEFERFSIKLDSAIASRRLHRRCDLVSFF